MFICQVARILPARLLPVYYSIEQALFQAVGFGLGGMISSVASGYIYAAWQGPGLFGVAAGGCLVTLGAHLLWFPRSPKSSVESGG